MNKVNPIAVDKIKKYPALLKAGYSVRAVSTGLLLEHNAQL